MARAFFLHRLFVIVSGVEHSGLLTILGKELIDFTGGDPAKQTVL